MHKLVSAISNAKKKRSGAIISPKYVLGVKAQITYLLDRWHMYNPSNLEYTKEVPGRNNEETKQGFVCKINIKL